MALFNKILIANRGEIACRIIRSAQSLGIQTVAVYSEADASALHVRMADEAVPIGGALSSESYLVMDRIIQACRDTGADAVHPGFGFLSENAAFVAALQKEGIAFIGPSSPAIEAMGDKIRSKELAAEAGVSTVPGKGGIIEDVEEALRIAGEIGYPVMIKASAGGGGKGMRVAWSEDEAREGFSSARSEAKSSFGDDRVFIEKFIENPRHIEIQVLADSHGNTLYLGERECSIQRRNQKVIEEAPSPFLDAQTRRAMGEQAVALARAVDYVTAGTVEFIVDDKKNFYFLEMNTRIQVEHPVTEMVTGHDLVGWMIRVAAGQALDFVQSDVQMNGWAIEARLYAEDPLRNFLPSIGRLQSYSVPTSEQLSVEGATLRIDSGVEEGAEISIYYDPMIAKMICHAPTRSEAALGLAEALDRTVLRGLQSNRDFLSCILRQDRFLSGHLTTNYLPEEFPDGFEGVVPSKEAMQHLIAVSALVRYSLTEQAALASSVVAERPARVGERWRVFSNGHSASVGLIASEDGFTVVGVDFEGETFERSIVGGWFPHERSFELLVDGELCAFQIERRDPRMVISLGGANLDFLVIEERLAEYQALLPKQNSSVDDKTVLSPMPGLLLSFAVEEGQTVEAGDELAKIEAMKMENILRAERSGTVSKLCVEPGESLLLDQEILEFED
ncbi:acetyl/propionyl/methylcrotonyl-CoA carboxylase subunit alpha [Kiloniella sp. b19]|uniref:acetyl/propionyl/methylcrotonyl-CoA carboxylase subunit alpha n=1 Tax=Kiloniella sp. GXU_MW_B19 TaxID=3141326 RepID=UPI0031DCA322